MPYGPTWGLRIDCYLALVKHLLPTDSSIKSSCLWHGDLHIENISVAPENSTDNRSHSSQRNWPLCSSMLVFHIFWPTMGSPRLGSNAHVCQKT